MKTAVLVLGALFVVSCAHREAGLVSSPTVAPRHALNSWQGEVRVELGSSDSTFESADESLVAAALQGVMGVQGVRVQVECLDSQSEIGLHGAVHARVRVDFPDRLTLEQKYEVLSLLESMKPGAAAFLANPPIMPAAR